MLTLSPSQIAIILLVSAAGVDRLWRFLQGKMKHKGVPFLPGPVSLPILGSTLSINREEPWKTYTEWHAIYGDVYYLCLLDQDVVVLGSQSAAEELLDKRSRIYSDRPFIATAGPYGIDIVFAFTPYSDNWRSCRRIIHQAYNADASLAMRPMQSRKALELAIGLIKNPDRFGHYYTVFSASVSLKTIYDYDPKAEDDPIVTDLEAFVDAAVPATIPEKAILLKLFPFLLHVPDWLPGSGLKREAKYAHDLSVRLTEVPFRHAEEHMNTFERPIVSIVSEHLSHMDKYANPSNPSEYVSILKKAAVSSLVTSGETTASSLMIFTLSMVLHPHVWKRAQAEIDTVIGTGRVPDFIRKPCFPAVVSG